MSPIKDEAPLLGRDSGLVDVVCLDDDEGDNETARDDEEDQTSSDSDEDQIESSHAARMVSAPTAPIGFFSTEKRECFI